MKNYFKKTYCIFHIKELSLEKIVEMFHDYSNSHGFTSHRERYLKEGIEMLVHFIAKKQLSNYDSKEDERGVADINYDIANKVTGDIIQEILPFLRESDIIRRTLGYIKGEKSFSYIINPEYHISPKYVEEGYPKKFYDRLYKALDDYEKKQQAQEKKTLPKQDIEFRKRYAKNLNKVKVVDKDGLKKFKDDYDYTYAEDVKDKKTHKIKHLKGEVNEDKKLFFQIAYDAYLEKKHPIYNWDEFGRIHHFLTNSPKDYRKYLNIWFHTDVHNCQPLLFCSLIYEYFKVTKQTQDYLVESFFEGLKGIGEYKDNLTFEYKEGAFQYHYEAGIYHNNNKDSELCKIKNEIEALPIDVLEYVYLVMSGKLWDVLAAAFGMEREDVKGTMFAELFYSNAKGVMSWQSHGQIFQQRFPNVTMAIVSIRNAHEKSWLPQEMQRRESRIMRRVLGKLMDDGYDVVSIHDAILMLDTANNHSKSIVYEDELGLEVDDNVETDVEFAIKWAYMEEGMGCAVGW